MMWRLNPSTLNPPALSADDDAAAQEKLPWVLLELQAYVAKRDNSTTAFSKTWDGKQIQVTFCPRRPPRVSYVCVHSPDAAEIHIEPTILAVEDELVLLSIRVGPQEDAPENVDYYVYQADDGSGGPSLTHLPRPPSPYFFDASDMGILRYRTDDQSGVFLRPHRPDDDTGYVVAGLHRAPSGQPPGQFDLCLYDSKCGDWKTHTVSLNHHQQQQHGGNEFYHRNCKVMAIGGDAGTMAFVDLWRGILFCDVRPAEGKPIPLLRYVALPEPLQSNKTLQGDARLYRNIAVVGDRLKYVELQLHWKASVVYRDTYFRDGWMAATWSRPATNSSSDDDRWREDSRIMDSKDLKVDNNPHFELLPMVQNDEGMTLPPFKRLDVCQPVLGLEEDAADIIYFTTKIDRVDANAWVVAVDMKNKELLGVAAFNATRYMGINFAYVHGRISKHLKSAPGAQGSLKRPGIVLPRPSSK
ncbi:uncharacterized protein LOC133885514 [Phragmites australis]|uniref:uncharacterized protein LOC133885514 n=1 Tax=Phragmites australis TaxID=29695 RepID=UPI002D776376|nr:uncharacterized protein LOC133885514 [Phragmites australis]